MTASNNLLAKPIQELKDEHYGPKVYTNPETKRLERLFFAHPEAVTLYKEHPDIVLLDCTYQTNRFRMPLLNICAVTGCKKIIQIALCFLSGKKYVSYAWAMQAFWELMSKNSIPPLNMWVTDRELALMNALDHLFPNSAHILCIWHVNMKILANCRKHFPQDETEQNKIIPDPKWEAFLRDWASLLASATEAEYASCLVQLRTYPQVVVSYIEDT
jgi:MULE transposase domain